MHPMPSFNVGAGDPDLDARVCIAGTLHPVPSLQACPELSNDGTIAHGRAGTKFI